MQDSTADSLTVVSGCDIWWYKNGQELKRLERNLYVPACSESRKNVYMIQMDTGTECKYFGSTVLWKKWVVK